MRTLATACFAATSLIAQSSTVIEPRLAGVLEPLEAAQFVLPLHGFSVSELAYAPVPHPALRAGQTTLHLPDPLLCSASYVGTEVAQLVFALPQGAIVLLDASSSLALHVLAVPAETWSALAGVCIDNEHERVVLLDAAGPSMLEIDVADVHAGRARFHSTALPPEWSTIRAIAFDDARGRIVGFDPATGVLLQHSAVDPNPRAALLRPVPQVIAFGFAPNGSGDHDLFVSSGDQNMLTSQWTWNAAGIDDDNATLRAVVSTASWLPPSPDPSGVAYDSLRDVLIITDGEVDEMTIYQGANVFECSRTGILTRTVTTVGYSNEPTDVAIDDATRTFYVSDDDARRIHVIAVGPDNLMNTADDTRRSFSVDNFASDAEGLAFDNVKRELWIAGGAANCLFRLRPGNNGIFDGTPPFGDDQLYTVDVAVLGVTDPEAIALRPNDGGIYVLGEPRRLVLHLNTLGQLVRNVVLPPTGVNRPAGMVFAPSSVGSGDSLYLVDRHIDNDFDPNENDGQMLEFDVPLTAPVNQPPIVNAGPDVTNLLGLPSRLSGSAADDGMPGGPLTVQWSLVSGPGTASFTAPAQPVTDVSFSVAGTYTCELSATDGALTRTDTVVITAQEPTGTSTVERFIATGNDDAEESPAGTVTRSSTDLEMVLDGTTSQVVGIRFQNLLVPNPALITSAYVQFTTDEAKSTATQLTIAGHDIDNAPSFSTVNSNISSRPRTTASVSWAPVPWTVLNEAGANQRTPQLASIVQEIVNRPGWTPGNAIAFVITGTGCRTASAYERGAAVSARLVVTYLAAAVINQPPVVNAGPDLSITLPSEAQLVGSISDDGLPGPVTLYWSQVSGPGTASFSTPAQATTDVAFDVAGTYTCQLLAFDGELTRTDTVVVTVQPAPVNQPPVVNAGPAVTIAMPSAAQLTGSVLDDGLSGPLTIEWSLVSGPGTASFTAPAQPVTSVTFSMPGTYTCQLTADDSEFTRADTVVVTVQPAPVNQPPVVDAGPDVSTVITNAANLAGTVTDDGVAGPLTIQWSLLSGPGTATFTAPAQPVTSVTFSVTGTYTCQLSASDPEFTRTDTVVVTVAAGGTVERAVATGSDDVEELPTGAMDRSSTDLELVVDGGTNQVVGLRFLNLQIPSPAVITSAHVQFTTDETKSTATQLTIAGQAADNAPAFTTATANVSSRPRTTSTVAWAPAPWTVVNEAGPNQQTPNLASIVQEIVNRPGWAAGNAMVFVITGTGVRTANAFEDGAALAARLVVTYQTPAPVNQPPVVNAGPDVTTALASAAHLTGSVTDDGLSGPLTIQWSLISGPGTASFTTPAQPVTDVTFSVAGSYTCQLSASDGEFTRTDTVVVTVQPAPVNQPPVVDAGPDVSALLSAAANLAGTVADDGLPGPLTIQWSLLSGPGTATFTAPAQPVTNATFSVAGTYTCQLSASDGEFTRTDTVEVTVAAGGTVERAVATGSDDVEELPTGAVDRGSSDLELVVDGGANQIVGLRFLNLQIPSAAVITSAHVQFTADEKKSTAAELTIAGQASDDALAFTTATANVSSRPRTTSTVAWAPAPWTVVDEAGPNQQTPNLASIVQEIVNRPGWAAGNAMVFVITGTGVRTASAFEDGAALAARLVVTYQTEAPSNQPPVVNAGPDVTTALASAAHLAGSVTDDGLSGPLTIQWSLLSGPGTASFTTPAQAVTDVTFSAAGSYTCQLSASDGEFTRTDTVVVTVTQGAPPNQPPVVDAGPDVSTPLSAAAHLAGTVADDGVPGPLTIQWSLISGPGTASFTAPAQAATDATFSAAGSYTCQLSASDGEFTRTDTVVVTVQDDISIERAIVDGHDDAEELPGTVTRGGNDLEMAVDGTVIQVVGVRFQNLPIPAGAVITSAYVQFTTKEAKSDPTQLTIAGHDTDNAGSFKTTASSISNRPRTTATVAWAPAPWTVVNEAGPNQRTPNLASIVQEIVNRPGWAAGNAMAFVITGTGCRTAAAYDLSPTVAARLVVTYQ